MVVKLTNINKEIEIVETKYKYFNTVSKHFVESKNPFLLVFVLIWHFNSISSHWEDPPTVFTLLRQSRIFKVHMEKKKCSDEFHMFYTFLLICHRYVYYQPILILAIVEIKLFKYGVKIIQNTF